MKRGIVFYKIMLGDAAERDDCSLFTAWIIGDGGRPLLDVEAGVCAEEVDRSLLERVLLLDLVVGGFGGGGEDSLVFSITKRRSPNVKRVKIE